MSRRLLGVLILAGVLTGHWPGAALALFPESIEQQRGDYLAAKRAIKAGKHSEFNKLYEKLDGYILQNYLEYEYLKRGIGVVPPETLKAFIDQNQHTPLAEYLRRKWLRYLARRGEWKTFMDEYGNINNDARLTCYRLGYLMETSQNQAPLMAEAEALWLTYKRLPSNCNAVFKAWREAGHMSRDLIWARIKLAMERGRLSLATSISNYLPVKDRVWVKRWKAMYRRPDQQLENIAYPVETPVARMIIKHGVVRLAYRDPEAAMQRWQQLKQEYQFFGEDENYVLHTVGILAAKHHLPSALEWLSAVSAEADDETLRVWRVKAALRQGDWGLAKQFRAALTEEEQQSAQWRYWRARILEENDDTRVAKRLFTQLAQERNYYGFLAADKLGRDYSMQHVSIEASPEEVSAMLARPGIQVAQELYEIGEIVPARRQWSWILRQMNNRELQVAAVIARHWGWYDRAIFTVNKSDHLDDLDLRFPVLYRDMVEANAAKTGLDTGWIYGVMRQESAFVADARSSAGALGLMQLMPKTGRQTGRRLKLNIRSKASILKVENNVLLGTSYLKRVLDRNQGHQALATASYNAGPHRVKGWLPEGKTLPADIWVETIPFNETRHYVKNVFGYTAIYDLRLDGELTRLSERMPEVVPRD